MAETLTEAMRLIDEGVRFLRGDKASTWVKFLESNHEQLNAAWPNIRDAVIDARRWESPFHFNGSFAEKVERAKPLPAISVAGEVERLIVRALVMLSLPQAEREALIRSAYDAEKAAREQSARERSASPGKKSSQPFVEIDLSQIEL